MLLLLNGNSGGCFRGLSSSNQKAIKPDPITVKPDPITIKPDQKEANPVITSTPIVHNQPQQEPNPNGHTPVASGCESRSSEPSPPLLVDHGGLDLRNDGTGVAIDSVSIQADGHGSDASIVSDTEPVLSVVNECDTLPKPDGTQDVANDLPEPDNLQDATFDDPNQLDDSGNDREEPIYENIYEDTDETSVEAIQQLTKVPEPITAPREATNLIQLEVAGSKLSLNAANVDLRISSVADCGLIGKLQEMINTVNAVILMREDENDSFLEKNNNRLTEKEMNSLRKVKPHLKQLVTQVDFFYEALQRVIAPLLEIPQDIEQQAYQRTQEIKIELEKFVKGEDFKCLQLKALKCPEASRENSSTKGSKKFIKKVQGFFHAPSKSSKNSLK